MLLVCMGTFIRYNKIARKAREKCYEYDKHAGYRQWVTQELPAGPRPGYIFLILFQGMLFSALQGYSFLSTEGEGRARLFLSG